MSFPNYPDYKDSGVEWLGDIPSHWTITKLKYVSKFQTGWTPPTGKSELFEGDNLWANISDLGPRILTDTAKRISDEAIRASNINISPEGSLLFSFKLSIGQVGFAGQDMYTNEAIATFMDGTDASLSFLYYSLPIFAVENASTNIYGAKLLNQELIKSSRLCLPPLSEQSAISAFLDRETAKIDALVAEQEKLIELLKEKRQAVISHAVTKGLDPNAPMKDSGVEWMGEVPEHWAVTTLGRITLDKCDGPFGSGLKSEHYADEGVRVIRLQNIRDGWFDGTDAAFIDEAYYVEKLTGHDVVVGDVLIAGLGDDRNSVGRACIAPEGIQPALVKADCFRFRVDPGKAVPSFLARQLTAGAPVDAGRMSTGSTRSRINLSTMATRKVALPPLPEQHELLKWLDSVFDMLEALILEAMQTITLLKERRSALISAAVTGKIDVRGLADPISENAMEKP